MGNSNCIFERRKKLIDWELKRKGNIRFYFWKGKGKVIRKRNNNNIYYYYCYKCRTRVACKTIFSLKKRNPKCRRLPATIRPRHSPSMTQTKPLQVFVTRRAPLFTQVKWRKVAEVYMSSPFRASWVQVVHYLHCASKHRTCHPFHFSRDASWRPYPRVSCVLFTSCLS